ncbi:hypothetical protein [uncultured Parabacteroides sp.]|uniref:hypothetical protein n=1 Tax=uncultured Parabacteroides sp. TaxID=512312 RepID=UPI002634E73A|nr:hypothetical protein [uncultured Parabacteroides sp.]
MKTSKKTPRRWRLNYVVTYLDSDKAEGFRRFVHDTLISVATLRRIDYAIKIESPVYDEMRDNLHGELQDVVADMFYFRSSPNSLSSIKEFRSIIDNIFRGYEVFLCGHFFDVQRLLQKYSKVYPFPEKFYRPLSYPYVEVHNGKEKTLCVTAASLENLLIEDMDPSLN